MRCHSYTERLEVFEGLHTFVSVKMNRLLVLSLVVISAIYVSGQGIPIGKKFLLLNDLQKDEILNLFDFVVIIFNIFLYLREYYALLNKIISSSVSNYKF